MRYMMMYKPGKESTAPPSLEHIAEMEKFKEQEKKSGGLLATDGLLPSALGARLRISNGKFGITDGPFTETKELIAGYAIVEAKSLEEAKASAKRFLTLVGEGEAEIRQMCDGPPNG